MSTQLSARPAAATRLAKYTQVCDSWCETCDGRPADQVAAYAMSAAPVADRAAAALGDGAHVHYVARGDRLMVVVPVTAA
ncbi:hypothetical protein [Streptomyces sp. NPDC089919]|uniref:hypothetical protein n=1 Tax=Streptomyces sp. NPDC089919 TaxID=3155188 RepID=UPI00342A1461